MKQCTTCQHTNYHNTTKHNEYLPQLKLLWLHKLAHHKILQSFWLTLIKTLDCCHVFFVCLSDILGEGNIHPKDLIRGPPWLVGFRGNEMERLTRQLRFEGQKLRYLYPTKYHKIKKRIRWLFRFYNYRRHKTSY